MAIKSMSFGQILQYYKYHKFDTYRYDEKSKIITGKQKHFF
jgi:hypothetical protein